MAGSTNTQDHKQEIKKLKEDMCRMEKENAILSNEVIRLRANWINESRRADARLGPDDGDGDIVGLSQAGWLASSPSYSYSS